MWNPYKDILNPLPGEAEIDYKGTQRLPVRALKIRGILIEEYLPNEKQFTESFRI